ncbi:MAG: type II toxin-antitoxin system VapC family toxin [Nanoarchaeota archaeon]
MKYLDTNLFVFAIAGDNFARKILENVVDGKLEAATSCLTWDEFVWALRKDLDVIVAQEEGRRLLEIPNMVFIDVTVEITEKAQEYMVRYNLKPRDALHVASMDQYGIQEIISADGDFDKVKEIKRVWAKQIS